MKNIIVTKLQKIIKLLNHLLQAVTLQTAHFIATESI